MNRIRLTAFFLAVLFAAAAAFAAEPPWTKRDSDNVRHISKLIGKRHGAITADLSDPQQLEFLRTSLIRAGHTPEKRPELHRSLAEKAKAYARRKPTNVSLLQAPPASTAQVFDYVDVLYISTPDDVNYTAQGLATFSSIQENVTTTIQLYDAETLTPIGTPGTATSWGGSPTLTTVTATAQQASGQTGEVLAIVTSTFSGDGSPYVAQLESDDYPASPPTVTAPVTTSSNNFVNICLGRGSQNNSTGCDYCLDNTSGQCNNPMGNPPIQLPLSGSVTFNSAIETPTAANTTICAAIMPSTGGACTLNLGNNTSVCTTTTGASALLSGLTTSNNSTTLSWNYNPTPSFGSSCWSSGQQVDVTYTITVTETDGDTVDVNVNNLLQTTCPPSSGQTANSTPFCPVQFVWGCLAGETPIRMADGSTKAIRDIQILDRIVADAKGTILTVSDTTIGEEKIPMYRIRDQHGDEILVTSGHPIATPGGTRLAKTLKVGDAISTVHGPSKITSIQTEKYDGKVYNLIVGAGQAEKAGLNDDNRTFVAGGIVVGDNLMQRVHGIRHDSAPVNIAARLSPRWRAEYERWMAAQK